MNAATTPEVLPYMLSRAPLGRFGQAEEVAALVAWLSMYRVAPSFFASPAFSGPRPIATV